MDLMEELGSRSWAGEGERCLGGRADAAGWLCKQEQARERSRLRKEARNAIVYCGCGMRISGRGGAIDWVRCCAKHCGIYGTSDENLPGGRDGHGMKHRMGLLDDSPQQLLQAAQRYPGQRCAPRRASTHVRAAIF
jgi:hypothetical protein